MNAKEVVEVFLLFFHIILMFAKICETTGKTSGKHSTTWTAPPRNRLRLMVVTAGAQVPCQRVDFPNKKGPTCVILRCTACLFRAFAEGYEMAWDIILSASSRNNLIDFSSCNFHFCTIFQMFHLTFFKNHRRQTHHKPLLWLWVYWVQLCVASCVPCHWKHRNSKRRWSTCPAHPVRPAEADSLSWSTLRSIQMQRSKEAKQHVEE